MLFRAEDGLWIMPIKTPIERPELLRDHWVVISLDFKQHQVTFFDSDHDQNEMNTLYEVCFDPLTCSPSH